RDPAALHPGVVPLVAPSLPLWPAAAVLVGLLPAFVTPAPEPAAARAPAPAPAPAPATKPAKEPS
ncbi:energy-coupling factor transporter transmembrane protein EcfT, partial [Streptomyces rochei]|nr:energy-coupling factor transporter transmembrane protein EcfT [Streptomyces rochei]